MITLILSFSVCILLLWLAYKAGYYKARYELYTEMTDLYKGIEELNDAIMLLKEYAEEDDKE